MSYPRVVVTGLGVVSSIGIGVEAFWDALIQGKSGISPVETFDTKDYPNHNGGEVKQFNPADFLDEKFIVSSGRGTQMAVVAAKEALEDSQYEGVKSLGLCMGTTMADIQILEQMNDSWTGKGAVKNNARFLTQYPAASMAAQVANYFKLTGPVFMTPTACAAGNYAISYAADMIRRGRINICLAGGADPFSRIAYTGFNRLLAMAPEKCQPFDKNRKGMMLGEGAGMLLLESLESALDRGASIYAEIKGIGMTCDANHMTIPNVEGVVSVMKRALADANLNASSVDYISAHGTGTPANDSTEAKAIGEVFGEVPPPASSIKSMLGHTMGAASAIEALVSCLVLQNQLIPPTINHVDDDEFLDCVPNKSRKNLSKNVVNNSFAFGGNNAAVIIQEFNAGNF